MLAVTGKAQSPYLPAKFGDGTRHNQVLITTVFRMVLEW